MEALAKGNLNYVDAADVLRCCARINYHSNDLIRSLVVEILHSNSIGSLNCTQLSGIALSLAKLKWGLKGKLGGSCFGDKSKPDVLFMQCVEGITQRWDQPDLADQSLVTVLSAIGKWGPTWINQNKEMVSCLVEEGCRRTRLSNYSIGQLTAIVHSVGTLGCASEDAVSSLVDEVCRGNRLSELNPSGVALVVYGLGSTGLNYSEQIYELVEKALQPSTLANMSNQGLCMLLTGFEKMGVRNSELLLPIVREAAIPPRLERMGLLDFLGIFHSYGRTYLRLAPGPILERIVQAFLAKGLIDGLGNRDLLNVMRCLAMCKYDRTEIWEKLISEASKGNRVDQFTPKDVSTLCWVMATSGVYDPELFKLLIDRYCAVLDASSVAELRIGVGQVVHSCAQLRYRASDLTAMLWNLMKENTRVAPLQLAQFLWMMGVIGWLRKDQYELMEGLKGAYVDADPSCHKKMQQFVKDLKLYARARKWGRLGIIDEVVPTTEYGLDELGKPCPFVHEVGSLLTKLNVGHFYMRVLGVVNGFVFSVPKRAVVLTLHSGAFVFNVRERQLKLIGPLAAKIISMEKIGYKVGCVAYHQWKALDETGKTELLLTAMEYAGKHIPPPPEKKSKKSF
ncbi:hypothetical protein BSKO_07541 [Bryopsis sp. KO-2023]|nr:hypothetical protein BSKO_07541 [Bryopsis sp. KO-2023]